MRNEQYTSKMGRFKWPLILPKFETDDERSSCSTFHTHTLSHSNSHPYNKSILKMSESTTNSTENVTSVAVTTPVAATPVVSSNDTTQVVASVPVMATVSSTYLITHSLTPFIIFSYFSSKFVFFFFLCASSSHLHKHTHSPWSIRTLLESRECARNFSF